jgi:hypothetical protein
MSTLDPTQQQSFQDLVTALLGNATATQENTKAITDLRQQRAVVQLLVLDRLPRRALQRRRRAAAAVRDDHPRSGDRRARVLNSGALMVHAGETVRPAVINRTGRRTPETYHLNVTTPDAGPRPHRRRQAAGLRQKAQGPMSVPPDRLYEYGSGLAVPGVEATLEYGDASTVRFDRIPGALLINDQAPLEKVRVTQLDGLQDDPEGRATSSPNADVHGDRAGQMLYGPRTIGLTGHVQAGNVFAMRDLWSRLRSTFGTAERDLLVHPPGSVQPTRRSPQRPCARST